MAAQESLLLGYMPHRDDFEDFDKTVEGLVSQIGDKSVQDEDVDIALKLGGSFFYLPSVLPVGVFFAILMIGIFILNPDFSIPEPRNGSKMPWIPNPVSQH